MEDSAERQMSSSIAWFRDWTTNERKSFGQVIIETEKNQGNLSYWHQNRYKVTSFVYTQMFFFQYISHFLQRNKMVQNAIFVHVCKKTYLLT